MRAIQPNEKLPFDALGHVFAYYAEEETIRYPLETLLLVCRAWNEAALGHRNLWGRFRIYLSHEPSSTMWAKRVPLRLARCGPITALDISILNVLDSTIRRDYNLMKPVHDNDTFSAALCPKKTFAVIGRCPCKTDARTCASLALRRLTGFDGDYTFRWKTLALDLGQSKYSLATGMGIGMGIAAALSYRTPNLTALELVNVYIPQSNGIRALFPHTPLLEHITVIDSFLPTLPSLENISKAAVGWSNCHTSQDFSSFRNANLLQDLTLCPSSEAEIPLPVQLDALFFLQIIGEEIPNDLLGCKMPQLVHLSLQSKRANLVGPILGCPGVPVQNLKQVTLIWDPYADQDLSIENIMDLKDSLSRLLAQAKSLERISADKEMLSIIVKILWDLESRESPASLPASASSPHTIQMINLITKATADIPRNVSAVFLVRLAMRWGLVFPNLSDDQFCMRMLEPWMYF